MLDEEETIEDLELEENSGEESNEEKTEEQKKEEARDKWVSKNQKRIDGLHKKEKDASRRASAAEERALRAEEELNKLKNGSNDKPLRLVDFESEEEYYKEVGRREAQKKWDENQEKADKENKKTQAAQKEIDIKHNFAVAMDEVSDEYEDFSEVIHSISVDIDSELGSKIMGAKKTGARLLYYLGMHPDELNDLKSMEGEELVWELGRIKGTLASPKKRKQKPKSKAPAPINPGRTQKTPGKPSMRNKNTSVDDYYKQRFG